MFFTIGGMIVLKKNCGALIGVTTVKVIGIDHGKWPADQIASGANRMTGAPRLGATLRNGKASGEIIERLVCVSDFDFSCKTSTDARLECLGKIATNDEDHALETCADGIIDRVVQYGFAIGAHGVHLLQSAVAGTHAGSQNQ